MAVNRGRGRPRKKDAILTRETVLQAASQMLSRGDSSLSLRGLAKSLGVDPMALYTYFDGRQELEEALVTWEFAGLYSPERPVRDWRSATEAVVKSYGELIRRRPGLLESILRLGSRAKGPAEVFRERFAAAIEPLGLDGDAVNDALELIVDYIHGYALAERLSEHGSPSPERFSRVVEFYFQCLDCRRNPT